MIFAQRRIYDLIDPFIGPGQDWLRKIDLEQIPPVH
jgi:hypothetical protein